MMNESHSRARSLQAILEAVAPSRRVEWGPSVATWAGGVVKLPWGFRLLVAAKEVPVPSRKVSSFATVRGGLGAVRRCE